MRYLLPVVTIGLLIHSIMVEDRRLTTIAIWMGGVTIFSIVIQCLLATRALCPLCMTPVLSSKGCSKHRNARTLLGSHRLRVAIGVLCKGSFTCPYCHEASILEVRSRNRMNYGRDSRS